LKSAVGAALKTLPPLGPPDGLASISESSESSLSSLLNAKNESAAGAGLALGAAFALAADALGPFLDGCGFGFAFFFGFAFDFLTNCWSIETKH
jgi:hypothetical protein